MNVYFPNYGTITLQAAGYTNCHSFSRAVFLELSRLYPGRYPERNNYAGMLANAPDDTNGNTGVYEAMIRAQDAQEFDVNACAGLPEASLIIFVDAGTWQHANRYLIQHSMIVTGNDCWTGANNGTSLGAGSNDVEIYRDVSQRRYRAGASGGWNNTVMRSILGDDYKMYYLPIL